MVGRLKRQTHASHSQNYEGSPKSTWEFCQSPPSEMKPPGLLVCSLVGVKIDSPLSIARQKSAGDVSLSNLDICLSFLQLLLLLLHFLIARHSLRVAQRWIPRMVQVNLSTSSWKIAMNCRDSRVPLLATFRASRVVST